MRSIALIAGFLLVASAPARDLGARTEWSFIGLVTRFDEFEDVPFDGPAFFGVEIGDPVSGRFVWYDDWPTNDINNPSFAEVYAGDQSFSISGGNAIGLWYLDHDGSMGIAFTFDSPDPLATVSLVDFESGVYASFYSSLEEISVRELPDPDLSPIWRRSATLEFDPSRIEVAACEMLKVPLSLSSTCAAQGFSFAVTHDPNVLVPLGAHPAGILASLRDGEGPEFWSVTLGASTADCPLVAAGLSVSMVTAFEGIDESSLPEVTGEVVMTLEYAVAPGAPTGTRTQLRPHDCLRPGPDAESTPLILSCGGESLWLSTRPAVIQLASACFRRGDCTADGFFDIVDPIAILLWLFDAERSAGPDECPDACDLNDDGRIDMTDAIHGLVRLFQGGPKPADPFDDCGPDRTDDGFACTYHACD